MAWIAGGISLFLIAAIVTVTVLIIFPSNGNGKTQDFITGNYVGRLYTEVREELKNSGINAKEVPKYDPAVAKGIIIYQSIKENLPLKKNYTIEFEVSQGVDMIQIPSLRDMEYREAEITLKNLKLNVTIIEEFSDAVAVNKVTRTVPSEGSDIPAGSDIYLFRSRGPEQAMIKVPSLVGKTVSAAKTAIEQAGLKVGTVGPSSSSSAKVAAQSLPADLLVRPDTTIDITTK